ncbi:MAG TPA: carbonic anhydrase [Candidatus Methylomirabilis sp.]|jgi:carbonic anhydrase|nr:carbonic anhydrase [Candidatus Methylomirabilis sp.]
MGRGTAHLPAGRTYQYWLNGSALDKRPAQKLAVVACMDARLHVPEVLALRTGDANIIRNAGGVVTEDVLRSLIVAVRLLGVRRILVINHTHCGMLRFPEAAFRRALRRVTGRDPRGIAFHGFPHLVPHLREQVRRIRSSPFIPRTVAVKGLVFDVRNGALREVA